jgi:hypothetical protein
MKIQITTEDFRNATSYTVPWSCPLAKAIERQVKDFQGVLCKQGEVIIRADDHRKIYRVTYDWCQKQKVYNGTPYEGKTINEMIDLAKMNPNIEFPTIELELV